MADLPSILGGLAQGFVDFGKGAVDMFGTGGAAIGDLIEGARTGKVTTKNQDDFRKWLYQTDSTKDAAAKGLGTALNGVQTVLDYIPGVNVLTRNPLGNAAQGALGGLADEFKTYGEDYDLGRAGQRAAVSGAAAAASGSLADALKGSSNALLSSNTLQGLARGATGGAISGGGYAAIDGGDVLEAAKQGAGMGALIGGATGAFQDFAPRKSTYNAAMTDEQRQARIANIDDQLSKLDTSTPEGNARYNELMNARNSYGQLFYHGTPKNPTESGDTLGSGLYITSNKDRATGYANGGEVTSYDTSGLNIANLDDVIPENVAKVLRDNPELSDKLKTLTPTTETYDLAQRDAAYNRFKALKGEYPRDLIEVRKTDSGFDISYPGDVDYTKITGKDIFRKLNTPEAQDVFMRAGYDGVSKTALGGDTEMAIYRNAPRALETTLSDADMAVNNPKLTPEQEAYFKDSVIRDENGNLMPLYHGSNSKFTVFDSSKGGQSNKTAKVGHWFTPSEEGARNFANSVWYGDESEPTVYSTYLNVKNPKIYEAVDNSAQIKALNNEMDTLQRQLDGMRRGSDDFNATYKKYNDLAKQIDNLSYSDPYEQFRSDIYAMEGKTPYQANVGGLGMMMDDENAATQKYVQNLRDQGYDGIIIRGTNYDNGTLGGVNDQYVVFDSNQIKSTNNLNPTENPDIRYSKAAPGQSLEKTLSNGDFEINRVGSANVAPVDTKTLPKSLQAAQEYLNEGNYIKDIENFAGKPYPKLTNQDYLDYAISLKNPKDREFYESIIKDMVDDGTTTYEKYAASAARNNRLNKLRMGSYDDIDPKALASYIANHRQALSNGTIRDVDAELSDRLGIGRSNTLMMDNNLPPDALGAYDPTNSTISIDTNAPEENLVNTLAHERLHSFQTEGDFKRYDKRVTDAYEELSKDLNKYLKTPEETAKRYAFDTDYWGNEREQQSRMLQQYLENKGFTRGGLQKSNAGEWGNEINPAFDKFFDKLRDLSKRGVALPALAALFGGGAYMASQENDKEKEVK